MTKKVFVSCLGNPYKTMSSGAIDLAENFNKDYFSKVRKKGKCVCPTNVDVGYMK